MSDPREAAERAATFKPGDRFVSCTCEGETCSICGKPASAKVGEKIAFDDPLPHRHNLTAYVCAEHFGAIFIPRPSISAAVQGGGDGLADRLQAYIDAFKQDAEDGWIIGERPDLWDQAVEVPLSELEAAIAALRAAPAPVPEVSDDMVERACRVWVDLDAGQPNVWPLLDQEERQVRSNIMRAALTAALASASAQHPTLATRGQRQ